MLKIKSGRRYFEGLPCYECLCLPSCTSRSIWKLAEMCSILKEKITNQEVNNMFHNFAWTNDLGFFINYKGEMPWGRYLA